MGLKHGGLDNKRDGMKWGDSGGCCSASIATQLVPPILKTILLGVAGKNVERFTVASLHPRAAEFVESISNLRNASLDYTSPAGKRLQVFWEDSRREDDDLASSLRLVMNNQQVFQGAVTIRQAFRRQTIAFAHSVVGAFELFYDHLLQAVLLGSESETEMLVGVCHIRGSITRPDLIQEVLSSTIKRNGREPYPGFDYQLVYGIFPDEGFNHFYGDRYRLEETPLAQPRPVG